MLERLVDSVELPTGGLCNEKDWTIIERLNGIKPKPASQEKVTSICVLLRQRLKRRNQRRSNKLTGLIRLNLLADWAS